VGFHMAGVQRRLFRRISRSGDAFENLLPNAALAPTGEPVIDGLVRTVFLGQSCQRQPTFRTCMIPLRMRRSSLRAGPGWFVGKCGTIFAHCSSLNQNKFASMACGSQTRLTKPLNQMNLVRVWTLEKARGCRMNVSRRSVFLIGGYDPQTADEFSEGAKS
jgi:hypothetical protein